MPTIEVFSDRCIACHDAQNIRIKFFDSGGRLWFGLMDDFVVIVNKPNDVEIQDFERLEKEAEEHEKQLMKAKDSGIDHMIG